MGLRRGLIDSNVFVAASDIDHQHHPQSFELLDSAQTRDFATSIHCLSEFYNGATRPASRGGSARPPKDVADAVARYAGEVEVLQLSQTQHIAALMFFARRSGIGPLVYDFLIGQVAVVHSIPLIVTWNVRHFAPLFPTLRVATPEMLLQEF